MEIDKLGAEAVNGQENSLPSLLVTLNGLFLDLEASICQLHAAHHVTLTLFVNFIVKKAEAEIILISRFSYQCLHCK